MKASIIVPAKNENENFAFLLPRLKKVLKDGHEIIIVDDVPEGTESIIKPEKNLRVINNHVFKGKGYAMQLGFKNAQNEICIIVDADLAHSPEDIPKLLKPLEDPSVGVVIGSRALGGSDEYDPIRAIGNSFLTLTFNFFFGITLFDSINGFKAVRRNIVADGLKINDMEIEYEILGRCIRKGYKIKEVASHEAARQYGVAKLFALKHGYKFMKQIIIEGLKYRLGFD